MKSNLSKSIFFPVIPGIDNTKKNFILSSSDGLSKTSWPLGQLYSRTLFKFLSYNCQNSKHFYFEGGLSCQNNPEFRTLFSTNVNNFWFSRLTNNRNQKYASTKRIVYCFRQTTDFFLKINVMEYRLSQNIWASIYFSWKGPFSTSILQPSSLNNFVLFFNAY